MNFQLPSPPHFQSFRRPSICWPTLYLLWPVEVLWRPHWFTRWLPGHKWSCKLLPSVQVLTDLSVIILLHSWQLPVGAPLAPDCPLPLPLFFLASWSYTQRLQRCWFHPVDTGMYCYVCPSFCPTVCIQQYRQISVVLNKLNFYCKIRMAKKKIL